ncbi:MAG TPA: hypothetical protein VF175_09975 [Lacipirellula sp.]
MVAAGYSTALGARGARLTGACFDRPSAIKALAAAALACSAWVAVASPAGGYTPDSPEVQKLIESGLKYLNEHSHSELGAKCLIAMAYHKHGASEGHPKIQEALQACRNDLPYIGGQSFNYGKCLAIIFLCELNAKQHRELIDKYVAMLREHQREHGGFTYLGAELGDTSQTQYAALAYWEMLNHGISPEAASIHRCLKWIMRTRDPSGMWAYHAVDPGNSGLVKQENKPGPSMTAAGMSAAMIMGNTIGLLKPHKKAVEAADEITDDLPPALRRQQSEQAKRAPTLPPGDVNPIQLAETLEAGRAWYEKNFTLKVHEYQSYYLYSVERYKSFEEYLAGQQEPEPDWYNDGVKFLQETQLEDGSWSDEQGRPVATAFSVLFLLRSTQKSIEARLGEGTLVGGRGLPRDLSKLKVRGGKLIVETTPTEVDRLLEMLDEPGSAGFEALLDDPAALQVTDVGPEEARRLQQIVKSGSAGARLMAVRALSEMRNLDYAPTLIFALTDPDKRVVREARDGLRSVSRNFEGFGPPDNFEEGERQQAVEQWKAWYQAARPDAPPLP